MPRTAEGRQLTDRHRQGQLQIRAQASRDFLRLAPLWRGDEASFRTLVEATIPLVQAHRRTSSAFASAYYEGFRKVEGVGGPATPQAAGVLSAEEVVTALYATGGVAMRKGMAAGVPAAQVMSGALARSSGAVTRHVLNGGRGSLLRSITADPQARGWARVTGGNACAFCAMLAGRGAAYGEDTADFEAHDGCACGAEPLYEDSALPEANQRFKALYDSAIAEAREAGELERGTSSDLLNAFRRAYVAG